MLSRYREKTAHLTGIWSSPVDERPKTQVGYSQRTSTAVETLCVDKGLCAESVTIRVILSRTVFEYMKNHGSYYSAFTFC